jgi:predicted alpha/beta-hydrolase family hydrolase
MGNTTVSIIENKVDSPIAQIIFAHGAGADMHHEFMELVTGLFNKANINVLRFNFPYMDKRIELGKRYPPDRMPKLIDCYKSVVNNFSMKSINQPKLPLFIGGKSMGSRVAAMIASDDDMMAEIQGVFCIGYPFHPPKKPEKLRLEPLQNTKKSVIILQGDRDTLGSKAEIGDYDLSTLCQFIFLPDGDHSLKPRVKSGYTHQQHIETAVNAIAQFIQEESANE